MKATHSKLIRIAIGLVATAAFSLLLLHPPVTFNLIEAKLYDLRFKLRGTIPPPDSVVIATIDEKSLERLGRWPWSRDVLARLVERLDQADAAVIAFDVIFPEPEANDDSFARAIEQSGTVILAMAFDFEHQSDQPSRANGLQRSALTSVEHSEVFDRYPPIISGGLLTIPVKRLRDTAQGFGHINMFPDEFDGTLRWEALLLGHDRSLYPALSLRAAADYLGIPPEQVVVDAARSIKVGKVVIPTDPWGRIPINYPGPGKTFRHFSVVDILDGKIGHDKLANRIVYVGATAIGIYDLRVTPVSAAYPGVEKSASVTASILEQRFIRQASQTQNLLFLAGSGLLLSLLLSRLRLIWGTLVTLAALLAVFSTGYLLFDHAGLWINLACPLNNIVLIFVSVTAWNYAFEERYARQIRAMFSSYVTQTIVNELINNPEKAKLGGERRMITVLFSDVRGFTSFSEQHSPEEVVTLLNELLGAMTDVILKWGGTLDKFIGDAIVVFWNAPTPVANHAERAVCCAVEMIKRLTELQKGWELAGKPCLSVGIGINTGEAVVGNIGAEGKKMDYTVIGDQVNLGARVESLTRTFKADILITEGTLAALQPSIGAGGLNGIAVEGIRRVIVKGKEQPVSLFRVTALESTEPFQCSDCPAGEPLRLTEK